MIKQFFKILSLTIFIFLAESSFLNYEANGEDFISHNLQNIEPPFLKEINSTWVDSVFNSLTPDERIGQLFMIASYSNRWKAHKDEITNLIKDYKIGGLIFFQGGPVRQARLTNYFQNISKTPLLIAMDAEWGLAMRLDSTIKFPRQMQLGAIRNDELIYEMGAEIARQCRRLGVHVNFAPVIDVNNNPKNPVINSRSFGEDKINVAQKGYQYMKGLQDNFVLATGKHFPGHGDTDSDSHKTLPIIKHSKERLDSLELYPFKQLIQTGLGGIMVAHLHIPALDHRKNMPSSLSKKIITDLLKNELKFKGLIFTDALNMNGVKKYFATGEVDVKAILAGNDILLMSENVEKAIKSIKQALAEGKITQEEIDKRCKKILAVKKWVNLDKNKTVDLKNLHKDLNNKKAKLLKKKLIEASVSLLENKNNIIPFKNINEKKIASIAIGTEKETTVFQKKMQNYTNISCFNLMNASKQTLDLLIDTLTSFDILAISIHGNDRKISENFGISYATLDFINKLCEKTKVCLSIFSNPYGLDNCKKLEQLDALLIAYQDDELSQDVLAQAMFGSIEISGQLPISINSKNQKGKGIKIKEKIRFKYGMPEEVGINSYELAKIDSIALDAIKKEATPGCQILFAKNGLIFYQKSFGYHTYKKKKPVKNTDLYDLASITKIAGTTASLMKLYDEKKFDYKKKLKYYLPEVKKTNKKRLKIRNILTHQSGLKPGIMFYHATVDRIYGKKRKGRRRKVKYKLKKNLYKNKYSEDFSLQITDSLFLATAYKDTMFDEILSSKLKRRKYKYSDLGFYFMQRIVEKISHQPLDKYLASNIYDKIEANRLTYNPLKKFSKSEIVPSTIDKNFRKQIIRGYVHDEGASMMGGVAGHAGLFSNAEDLAKLMQVFLKNGEYAGNKIFSKETIDIFTACQFCRRRNRRALGFDKPQYFNKKKYSPVCEDISKESFGHTGFTGTIAWADPKEDLIYIFLSNRTYPNANNRKLQNMKVRRKIQKVVYDVLK